MSVPNNSNQYLPGTIFIPSSLEITAITKAYPMVVTVQSNSSQVNTYIAGMLVRLFIPYTYGMFQANGLTGKVLTVSPTQLSLDIDSSNFDTFSIPPTGEQPASLSPAGSQNLQYSNSTNQVAFQPYNDRGN